MYFLIYYRKEIFFLTDGFFVSPVRAEKICYLSPDWFSFDSHVLVGGGDREV